MEKNNLWYDFFEFLPKYRQKLAPIADRSGISADSAILLTLIYEFKELSLPIDNELYNELISKGLLIQNNGYNVTGKGAILAKSFVELRKGVL